VSACYTPLVLEAFGLDTYRGILIRQLPLPWYDWHRLLFRDVFNSNVVFHSYGRMETLFQLSSGRQSVRILS